MKNGPVRVGIIGSQFQADCHASAISMIEGEMIVVAVASPNAAHAQGLADRFKIPKVHTDYKKMLKDPEIEAVTITAPNALHCEMAVAIAQSGKHVICEKPLCVTLEEADKMIAACRANSVLLPLCRVPHLHPQIRESERNGRRGRFRQSPHCETK